MERLSKKEKGLMGTDNSVVIAEGRGYKGTKWYGKNPLLIEFTK